VSPRPPSDAPRPTPLKGLNEAGVHALRKARPGRGKNFITEVLLPSFFSKRSGVRDHKPIFPKVPKGQVCLTWIGHASFLIQTHDHNILVDPNWANWMLVIRRLRHAGLAIDDLPNIDLVLITHAHFDHLNRRSLRQIAARQPIVVPSGVANLVHDLGFEKVHEMNWWDSWTFRGLKITFTPAKHWGARVLHDKHRGYGGYCIEYQGRSVFHCGDTAYFNEFKEIGRRLKPEIVLMPIGAYENPSKRDVHIGPEQAVVAFHELRGKTMIPMHFGTYRMSFEPLHEPAQRLLTAAAKEGISSQIRFLIEGMPQLF
jgi:L-ascorbate metabolism protein UlaG (beta-lactamase superfamily)